MQEEFERLGCHGLRDTANPKVTRFERQSESVVLRRLHRHGHIATAFPRFGPPSPYDAFNQSRHDISCILAPLQVIVSGPSGFVFHVETTLARIGVPEEAVVLLD